MYSVIFLTATLWTENHYWLLSILRRAYSWKYPAGLGFKLFEVFPCWCLENALVHCSPCEFPSFHWINRRINIYSCFIYLSWASSPESTPTPPLSILAHGPLLLLDPVMSAIITNNTQETLLVESTGHCSVLALSSNTLCNNLAIELLFSGPSRGMNNEWKSFLAVLCPPALQDWKIHWGLFSLFSSKHELQDLNCIQ